MSFNPNRKKASHPTIFAPVQKRSFPAVSALTFPGKILVFFLRIVFSVVGIFKGKKWQFPLKNFEENPLYYSKKDVVYFGYKYYFHPPEKAEKDSKLESYFHGQNLDFSLAGFVPEKEITLSVGGDLMPYAWLTKENTKKLWNEIGDWFFSSDLVFANLETPIVESKAESMVAEVMLNDMLFNASADLFDIFSGNGKHRGYDILSTANNHSMDMGPEGVEETIRFLEKKKVKHSGTSLSKEKQFDIPVLEKNGISLAFASATYSLNHLDTKDNEHFLVNHGRFNLPACDLSLIKKLVESARKKSPDLVILSLHTGNAYQAYPSTHTVEIIHRIFDECGPDIILSGHPHNPQPMEKYAFSCPYTAEPKEGLAVYSLGDFVAYDIFTWCHLHLMLKIKIGKGSIQGKPTTRITGLEILPHQTVAIKQKGGYDFRFVPLLSLATNNFEYPGLSARGKQEARENFRFWTAHLAPQMEKFLA